MVRLLFQTFGYIGFAYLLCWTISFGFVEASLSSSQNYKFQHEYDLGARRLDPDPYSKSGSTSINSLDSNKPWVGWNTNSFNQLPQDPNQHGRSNPGNPLNH